MKLLAALLAFFALQGQTVERPAYAAGQVWEYRTRAAEPESLLKIQQVEKDPNGTAIYHVSVIGVRLPGGAMPHLPVSRETLDASVTRLSPRTPAFPDPSEGISIWRENKGGVFTVSIAEALDFVDQAIAQGQAKQQ